MVYVVICKKEGRKKAYLGRTKRMLKFRLADPCGYVLNDLSRTVIKQSKRNNNLCRKEREDYHINRFNNFYKGLNKKKK